MLKLSPSILSADFLNLGDEIERVEKSGCDYIHIDVTDGHFVPNLTMGVCIAQAVCEKTKMRKDVHLMIANPQDFIKKFADIGGDLIIFHAEATVHPFEMIKYIRESGKMVGIALDPATPIDAVAHVLHAVDVVLLVAVCVGFGGQGYIEENDEKIKKLASIRKEKNLQFEIQVDGGITTDNAKQKYALGVDTIVAGTMFFDSDDTDEVVKKLR